MDKKLNKRKPIIALALCISTSMSVMADEADDAYKALRKFESKVETGVTYRKYLDDLSDVAFAVKEFSAVAKGNKENTAKIIFASSR